MDVGNALSSRTGTFLVDEPEIATTCAARKHNVWSVKLQPRASFSALFATCTVI